MSHDIASLMAKILGPGASADAPGPRCAGGCRAEVSEPGRWCPTCGERDRRERRLRALEPAYASLPAWSWCRLDAPLFRARTRDAAEMVEAATAWRASTGNLVLLGPTGIGKTSVVVALAHKILDYVRDHKATPEAVAMAKGMRFVDAIDLGIARRNWPLGQGDPPLLIVAREAPILILDEVGREPTWDTTMFELFNYRYRRGLPIVATSRLTEAEMKAQDRYGVDGARRILESGKLVNLYACRHTEAA